MYSVSLKVTFSLVDLVPSGEMEKEFKILTNTIIHERELRQALKLKGTFRMRLKTRSLLLMLLIR